MLLTRHFVFVHLLKSGGTFVKRILLDYAPADWACVNIEGHPSVADIPETHRHLPRIGFVRNPWDWYVSAYHYFKTVDRAAEFDALSDDGSASFGDTLTRAMAAEPYRSAGVGPMSLFVRHTYGDDPEAIRLMRFEHLRDDLLSALAALPVPIPEALSRVIREHPPLNRSEHDDYRAYYDDNLRQAVAERDGDLIRRFGYTF